MGDITFPTVSGGPDKDNWVTVDSADIASLEQAGAITIVTMKGAPHPTIYRSPAPIELLMQGVDTGQQPVEPLPPSDPTALAASPWRR
jgi:hypothetical protein